MATRHALTERYMSRMKNPETKVGTAGRVILGAFVTGWEVSQTETLSSAFDRYLQHPVKKYAAIGAVAVTGAHLLNLFDHLQVPDPISLMSTAATNLTENLRERLGHGRIEKG